MGVIMSFPEQIEPLPDVRLIRDASFYGLFDALHRGMNVQATFEGRFEAAFTWHDNKRIMVGNRQQRGFGKKHEYGGRLILYRVSDVLARQVPRR
jgi:hypothetical protein